MQIYKCIKPGVCLAVPHACSQMASPPAPVPALSRHQVWSQNCRNGTAVAATLRKGSGTPHTWEDGETSPNFTLNLKGQSPPGLIGFGSVRLIVLVVKLACFPGQFKREATELPAYYELGSRCRRNVMNEKPWDWPWPRTEGQSLWPDRGSLRANAEALLTCPSWPKHTKMTRWDADLKYSSCLWPYFSIPPQASEPPCKTSLLYKNPPDSKALPLTKMDSDAPELRPQLCPKQTMWKLWESLVSHKPEVKNDHKIWREKSWTQELPS